MKKLFLVRHAKSSWEEPGKADIDRQLTEQGHKKTEKVIQFLNKRKIRIDRMISSPAVRAYQTAVLIAKGIGYPVKKIQTDHKIYNGGYDRILDLVYSTPDEVESLMIFGHNPVITQLANLFLHPGIDDLPTTGMVSLKFNTDQWSSVPSAEPETDFIIFPKML